MTEGPGTLTLALLVGLLVLADGALAALGLVIWYALWRGHLGTAEAATLLLLGASAAVGTLTYLLALLGLARGPAPARLASALAVLRVVGVLAGLAFIATRLGTYAIVGLVESFGAVVAVAEASGALMVTRVVKRRAARV